MTFASDEAISEALQGLLKRKGVQGYVILDKSGLPIKSSFEPAVAQAYAGLVPPLVYLADDMVRDADPQDELQFLRVRSAKQEIMVSAHVDYTLAVIQATAPQATGK